MGKRNPLGHLLSVFELIAFILLGICFAFVAVEAREGGFADPSMAGPECRGKLTAIAEVSLKRTVAPREVRDFSKEPPVLFKTFPVNNGLDYLTYSATKYPDREAYVWLTKDGERKSITYAAVRTGAELIATTLLNEGRRQPTVLLRGSSATSAVAAWGILASGALGAGIPRNENLATALAHLRPDFIFVQDVVELKEILQGLAELKATVPGYKPQKIIMLEGGVRELAQLGQIVTEEAPVVTLDQFVATANSHHFSLEEFSEMIDPSRPALLTFTSGSTGSAKAFVHDHRALRNSLRSVVLESPTGKPPIISTTPEGKGSVPQVFVPGDDLYFYLLAFGASRGYTVVIPRSREPLEMLLTLKEFKPTISFLKQSLIKENILPEIRTQAAKRLTELFKGLVEAEGSRSGLRPAVLRGLFKTLKLVGVIGADVQAPSDGKALATLIADRLVEAALDVGALYRKRVVEEGGQLTWKEKIRFALFERLIYRAIHEQMGGSVEVVLMGSEKLDHRLLGILGGGKLFDIWQNYGSREAFAISHEGPRQYQMGRIGKLVEGVRGRLKLDDGSAIELDHALVTARTSGRPVEGLLEVVTPALASSYYASAESMTNADGYFETKDRIAVHPDGFLEFIGRSNRFVRGNSSLGDKINLDDVEKDFSKIAGIKNIVILSRAEQFAGQFRKIQEGNGETNRIQGKLEETGLGYRLVAIVSSKESPAILAERVEALNRTLGESRRIQKLIVVPDEWNGAPGSELISEGGKLRPFSVYKKYIGRVNHAYQELLDHNDALLAGN